MKKLIKTIIVGSLLSIILTICPNLTVKAKDSGSFDINSVDQQSAEIIQELKDSNPITYIIEEEANNLYVCEGQLNEQIATKNSRAGVTKIVWHSGFLNFDLYLSKDMKSVLSSMTVGGIIGYLVGFLPLETSGNVIAESLKRLLPNSTNQYGSVYVFKNGSYRYNYHQ